MSFFSRAVALGLKEFPRINAEIDGSDVVYNEHVHLGIAVSTVEKQHARALRLLRAALPGDPDSTPDTKANS